MSTFLCSERTMSCRTKQEESAFPPNLMYLFCTYSERDRLVGRSCGSFAVNAATACYCVCVVSTACVQ